MSPYLALAPEILLLLGALISLFGEFLPGPKGRSAYLGAVFAFAAAALSPLSEGAFFHGSLVYDGAAALTRTAVAGLTGLFLLWLGARGLGAGKRRVAAALALFAGLGGMLLAAAHDLVTLYIALELSTMPAYVLIGFARRDARGLEGALKYFLLSMLTSLVMAYGLSFLYGFSGTTNYDGLTLARSGNLGAFVAVFVVVGFMAKLSAAPFHYWTPDAYEGATAHAVAFVSTVPKVAGLAAMVRLVSVISPGVPGLGSALWLAAAASIVLGNLGAFPQTDMRRLMAYSGIAHTGYLLMGLAAGTEIGAQAAIVYAVAYSIPSLGAMLVFAEHGTLVEQYGGLANRRPGAAWALVAFFISLVGIPPMVGFFGKLWLFGSALQVELTGLVVIAVLASVASLGYYFRVVRDVFYAEVTDDTVTPERSRVASAALALAVIATLASGIGASPALRLLGLEF